MNKTAEQCKQKEKGRPAACRFFGRADYGCEVGGPNASPHDVEIMVKFCNGRFNQCARYKMLAERWSGALPDDDLARVGTFASGTGGLDDRAACEVARGVLQHELRTPITAILTSAEILQKKPDRAPEVRDRFVGVISEEAKRLKRTVESLFDGLEQGSEPGRPSQPETEIVEETHTPRRSGRMKKRSWNRGWSVVLAGTGINLALGILYTWSIFKGAIRSSIETGGAGAFDWELSAINDPYAVCCLVFAFAMIVAGKVQDKFGPRLTALMGGLMVGGGFLLISQTTSYWAWVAGFGVLAGMGIGFGYSSATPPALKWFPPNRTGIVAGIVVSGFGLASVYIAPLAKYLLAIWGIQKSMFFFGVSFTAVVGLLSMLLANPPEGHLFAASSDKKERDLKAAPTVRTEGNYRPSQMIKTINFYVLWTIFFIGSGAGLMVIGSVAGMAKASLGEAAFVVVALMAIGNAGGRIVAGFLSDKIGRSRTLMIMLAFQAALMFGAIPVVGSEAASPLLLVLLASFIGFNYGTNLTLFPSITKDLWGMQHFGMNYGILFSAWGVGGFILVRASQMLVASSGNYDLSFMVSGVLLIVGAGLTLTLREGKQYQQQMALEEEREKRQAAAEEAKPAVSEASSM